MDWSNLFLGGLEVGRAPTPAYQHQGQIEGLIGQGFGRTNQAAPQLDAFPQDQFRQGQTQQIGQLQGIASGQQKGAGMGQQAALQDQMNAQGLLAGALSQGRGQDLSLAGQNANLTQQGQQMNNQMYIQLLSQLTGMDANLLAAQFQAWQADKQQPGLLGGLLSAGGQVAAAAAGGKGG